MIFTVPPRTLKSILITICFPVWCWLTDPSRRFMCASYSAQLSAEHSVKRRDLIQSEWFQKRWGDRFTLKGDVNRVNQFDNDKTGQMIAISVGGQGLGKGGDTVICDDILNPQEAASDIERTTANNWLDNTVRFRINDPASGMIIIVMQRLHEMDPVGYVQQQEPGRWLHVNVPREAEQTETITFPASGRVFVRPKGDILQPKRCPPNVVASMKVLRMVWASQQQQRPAPLEGNLIKRSDIKFYGGRDPLTLKPDEPLPDQFDSVLISADCAFKDLKTSDYVAIGAVGVKGPKRYILEIVNAHLGYSATKDQIRSMREKHKADRVLIEDKANGSAVISELILDLPGIIAVNPQGGKTSRLMAVSGEWQASNWYMDRNAAWTEPAITQLITFPNAANDDIVDCLSQAGTYLQQNSFGILEFLKQEVAALQPDAQTRLLSGLTPQSNPFAGVFG
jgi:predicted phage terminase large subunit-like protein